MSSFSLDSERARGLTWEEAHVQTWDSEGPRGWGGWGLYWMAQPIGGAPAVR